ncbi:hypothetical protein G6F24_016744 [Rhizopus arrhizus]|nr:hypothetical protein G6F24_016744 [Rhizopus arrhizus]
MPRHPAGVLRLQLARQQPGMVVPLHYIQDVAFEVLARHIPGFGRAVFALASLHATHAQALALAQRVEGQAFVAPDLLPFGRQDRPRFGRQVAVQEFAERPFADEADPRGILLGGVVQANLVRDTPHFGLVDLAQREQGARQLRLV